MTYRARVVFDDPLSMRIQIAIGRPVGEGQTEAVTGLGTGDEPTFGGHKSKIIPAHTVPPTLSIPDETARALLDALSRHYGGATDTRTLRKDYEAGRARVDRLLEVLAHSPREAS